MIDLGFEPTRSRTWLSGDNPALDRMADVVLTAMTAAGGEDPELALTVLTKVQAMVVAGMVRHKSADEVRTILQRVGPAVGDEAVRFLRAVKRDLRTHA